MSLHFVYVCAAEGRNGRSAAVKSAFGGQREIKRSMGKSAVNA